MFRNIGSFWRWCFTNMCVSQISWATALWGVALLRYLCTPVGTCRCGTHRHDPRSPSSQCGRRAWRCRRGASGRTSNQAAREGEPATFPKHAPPCVPEPP